MKRRKIVIKRTCLDAPPAAHKKSPIIYMSSSDYIALRRMRRTVGNLPYHTGQSYMENMKMNNVQCIYNNKSSTPGEVFSVYDIAPKTDFTNCLSSYTYSYSTAINPIVTKEANIHTPVYVKNRTITRKCCFKHPSIRAGCSDAVLLRVCNSSDYTVRKNINT